MLNSSVGMNNVDFNSVIDLDQETDVILTQRKIADQKEYKCKYCCKLFSQARNLKRHIHTIHDGNKDYKCESCGKSFSQPQHLKGHIHTVHEGHKDYKCESCSKSFSQPHNLKKHIHRVHKD